MEQANYAAIAQMQEQNWWYRARRKLFGSAIEGSTFSVAADFGAGMGANYSVLSAVSGRVIAIDPESESIEACSSVGYSETNQSGIEKLDLQDGSIDLALLADVLEHVDDEKAISELWRVLRSGSTALISVPAFQWLWNWNDEDGHHLRRYSKKELREKLQRTGFVIERISYWNALFVLPVFLVSRIQRFRVKPTQLHNNLSMVPTFLNSLLVVWMSLETRFALSIGLPFGVSVFAIVRKPSIDHTSVGT